MNEVLPISAVMLWRSCGARKVRLLSLARGPLSAVSDVSTAVSELISAWVELYWVMKELIALAIVVTSGATVTSLVPVPVAVKVTPGTPRVVGSMTLLLLWRTCELPLTVNSVDWPTVSVLSAEVSRSAEAMLLVPSATVMSCGPRDVEVSTSWSSNES